MTTLITLVPGILTFFYLLYRTPEKAFLNIYLPVLILLPQFYVAELKGFADLSAAQATIIPIFFAYFLHKVFSNRYPGWQIGITDYLVVGYVFICTYSEYVNTGGPFTNFEENLAVTLFSEKVTKILLPYFLAKRLIHAKGNTVPMAKRLCVLMIINLFLSAYEWRFVTNPYVILPSRLFPSQIAVASWTPSFRYGLVRISGPFFHPILFGMMFAATLMFAYWLYRNHFFKRNFSLLPPLPVSKGFIITFTIFLGLIFTFSRGPQLSFILGALFIGVGFSHHRIRSVLIRFTLLAVFLLLIYQLYVHYSQIDKYRAETNLASTAAYRIELIHKYMKYVNEKPWWGWGYTTWPKAVGLLSIDNQYLWLILKHGIVSFVFYIAIICWMMLRVFIRGMKDSVHEKTDSSLSFTFFGIYLMFAASFVTVYMGEQIEPLFFILIGWGEGFLSCRVENPDKSKKHLYYPKRMYARKA